MRIELRADNLLFWTIYFHDKDALLPGFGQLFGSTFEAIPALTGSNTLYLMLEPYS